MGNHKGFIWDIDGHHSPAPSNHGSLKKIPDLDSEIQPLTEKSLQWFFFFEKTGYSPFFSVFCVKYVKKNGGLNCFSVGELREGLIIVTIITSYDHGWFQNRRIHPMVKAGFTRCHLEIWLGGFQLDSKRWISYLKSQLFLLEIHKTSPDPKISRWQFLTIDPRLCSKLLNGSGE